MSLPDVRMCPSIEWEAEVVVLVTTLGAKRTEYNAGKRVRDLLEIKRVHYKMIDFNRDARAVTTEVQGRAVARLSSEESIWRRLHTDEDDDLILPQVYIDGLYIGNYDDLQGLEDDGLLNDLLRRQRCPCRQGRSNLCNFPRVPDEDTGRKPSHCPKCGESFAELLPREFTREEAIAEYFEYFEEGLIM